MDHADSPTFAVVQDAHGQLLTDPRFAALAAVPAEVEWFANIDNPRTRRAYQGDLQDFTAFIGMGQLMNACGIAPLEVH